MRSLTSALRPAAAGLFLLASSLAWAQTPCTSVSISPSSATVAAGGGPVSTPITISSGSPAGCRWTAVSNDPWITISFGSSGTTSGTTGYAVAANPSTAPRTGTISIANQTFTVTQSGASCSYSVSPTSGSAPAAGTSGSFIVRTPQGCAWTPVSSQSWIRVTSGAGNGDGVVEYTVDPNPGSLVRFGSITAGSATFQITQSGFVCTYTLSPSSLNVGSAGGNGSFSLTTPESCSWQAVSNASWITVTSAASGTGPSSILFSVAPSPEGAGRSGTISVGTATFTVNQSAACVITLNPTSQGFGPSGGTGTISVTTSVANCERPAVSTVPWITITSGAGGSGSGQVSYSVAANTTSVPREGTITIGGQPFVVTQQAGLCSLTINPVSLNMPSSGGNGRINIASNCTWTAAVDVPWVQFSSATTGTGNGSVDFRVASNQNPETRVAAITIGNQVFNVYQAGTGQQPECRITLSPPNGSTAAAGGSGEFQVTASADCLSWRAVPGASWLRVTGTTDSSVIYAVERNRGEQVRTGTIDVSAPNRADASRVTVERFTVRQEGAVCQYSVHPASASFPAAGGTGSIDVATECAWSASSNRSWITLASGASGSGNGKVEYRVQENTSAQPREGVITAANQQVRISQAGASCSVTLSRTSATLVPAGGAGQVAITVTSGCEWSATTDAPWLTVTYASAGTSGAVYYSAGPNTTGAARTAQINVQGQMFSVAQASGPYLTQAGVVNAASFSGTSVSPGMIATIFGSGLGPAQLAPLELTPEGSAITTSLAGTRVLFDGVPAPLLYTSAGQVSAVVPYAVRGKLSTRLAVEYLGILSNEVLLPVSASSPAIFTVEQSGTGQGAVLNQDGSVNSGANRARRGEVVMIFATGGGETDPAGQDGLLVPAEPLRRLQLPVSVAIGGQPAQVLFAGSAPGLVSGLVQINARVAANAQVGEAAPLVVTIGGVPSQAGVTIAVR